MRTKLLAGALALSTLLPVAAVVRSGPAAAATACDATAAWKLTSDLVGLLPIPYASNAAAALGAIGDVQKAWKCGDHNMVKEMTKIANEQAHLAYQNGTVGTLLNKTDDMMAQWEDLRYDPDTMTDDEPDAAVDTLDSMWRDLSGDEQAAVDNALAGTSLTFKALPAVAGLVSVKMGLLDAAYELEDRRVQTWRTLATSRHTEARQSLHNLTSYEGKLEHHIAGRFRLLRYEPLSRSCTHTYPDPDSVECTWKYKVSLFDKAQSDGKGGPKRLWDTTLTHVGPLTDTMPPTGEAAYKSALHQGRIKLAGYRQEVRAAFLTPEYQQIKDSLRHHANAADPQAFRTRDGLCNDDQYVILTARDKDLALRANGALQTGTPLKLNGDLAAATTDPHAQFKQIRDGHDFIFQVRSPAGEHVDLTWLSNPYLRLGTDANSATWDEEDSQFHVYLDWQDHVILQRDNQDQVFRLDKGQMASSRLLPLYPILQAQDDARSQFNFTCWPASHDPERSSLLWR